MGLARRGEQRTGAPATAKEGRGRLDAPAFGDRTGFLRERKALCTVVTVTVLFKSNAFEFIFILFAGEGWMDGEIVLKEKKQKKKFSEPDFLRS